MIKIRRFLIISSIITSCITDTDSKNVAELSFAGDWTYIRQSDSRSYDINLEVSNNSIIGKHCFVGNNGNRIDCSEKEISINAKIINKSSAKGNFKSFYSDKNYDLNLKLLNDTLYFSLKNNNELFYSQNLKFIKSKRSN